MEIDCLPGYYFNTFSTKEMLLIFYKGIFSFPKLNTIKLKLKSIKLW